MTNATIQKKVLNIQAELDTLKKTLVKRPDFGVDEALWRKIKPTAKRVRRSLYRRLYGKRG